MQSFEEIAETVLNNLLDVLEAKDSDHDLDIDLLNGVLTIGLLNGQEYVINRHVPTQQIWVSSPLSGATHFDLQGEVFSTNSNELHALLYRELAQLTSIRFNTESEGMT